MAHFTKKNNFTPLITKLMGLGVFSFALIWMFATAIATIVIFQEGYNQYQE